MPSPLMACGPFDQKQFEKEGKRWSRASSTTENIECQWPNCEMRIGPVKQILVEAKSASKRHND